MKPYSLDEIIEIAGEHLVKRTIDILGNEEECISFFNSKQHDLHNKTPYDICKENKKEEVFNFLGKIEDQIMEP